MTAFIFVRAAIGLKSGVPISEIFAAGAGGRGPGAQPALFQGSSLLLTWLGAAVSPALCEEFLFRGFLLSCLRQPLRRQVGGPFNGQPGQVVLSQTDAVLVTGGSNRGSRCEGGRVGAVPGEGGVGVPHACPSLCSSARGPPAINQRPVVLLWMSSSALVLTAPTPAHTLLTGVLFAAIHLDVNEFWGLTVLGMACGGVASVSGSVLPAVALHLAYNTCALALAAFATAPAA